MELTTDTASLPRVYRMVPRWMVPRLAFGCAALAAGSLLLYPIAMGQGGDLRARVTVIAFPLFFALFGVWMVLDALRSRIVLYGDRIESESLLTSRVLLREQIEGRRFQRGRRNTSKVIVLVPRDGGPRIKVPLTFRIDGALQEWIDALPDLDRRDREASEAEILKAAPSARPEDLARARQLTKVLAALGFGVFLWLALVPKPYWIAVLAAGVLPWGAVYLAARPDGLIRITQRKNDAHPSVLIAFMMPVIALLLRAIQDYHVLDWQSGFGLAAAVGVFLWGGAVAADASLRREIQMLAAFFVLSACWGYGAGMAANAYFDESPATVYTASVVGKHVSHGKSTTWYLNLAPWGPEQRGGNVSVPWRLYRSVQTGDAVCLPLKRGALRVAWYVVQPCRSAGN